MSEQGRRTGAGGSDREAKRCRPGNPRRSCLCRWSSIEFRPLSPPGFWFSSPRRSRIFSTDTLFRLYIPATNEITRADYHRHVLCGSMPGRQMGEMKMQLMVVDEKGDGGRGCAAPVEERTWP